MAESDDQRFIFGSDALKPLSERFTDIILTDQDCFKEREGWEELLKLLPDKSIVAALQGKWDKDEYRPSEEKWDDLKREIQKYKKPDRVRPLFYWCI